MKKSLLKLIRSSRFQFLVLPSSLVLFLGIIIWILFDSHIIFEGSAGNLMTGESTYGDLPFHLAGITQMAYTKIFPFENPFFAGKVLVYPFFINYLSALMVKMGTSLRLSIIVPGMFFSIAMVLGLYYFYLSISKDKFVAYVSTLLFFLYGGLGFYYFLRDVLLKGKFVSYFQDPGEFIEYSHVFDHNIHWVNFLSRILIPERSVLLGIPMGLLILYLLFIRERKQEIGNSLFIAAILTGLLPFAHTHTFITFALVIPTLAIMEYKKKNAKSWLIRWLVFGSIAFVIALPQLVLLLSQVSDSESFMRFRIGWMSKPGVVGFLVFWLKNAGALPFLAVGALFIKNNPKLLKQLVIIGFIIFVIINLFIFQPFDWDNVKFLFWFGIFAFLAASSVLVYMWRNWGIIGKLLGVLLFLSMTLSGALSIYREVNVEYQLFSKEDVLLGEWVKNNTEPESIFLTGPSHNSFVNNLSGRRILMGYQGLLWVHGINYSKREREIKEIYGGEEFAETLLEKNEVDYVVVGPNERHTFQVNTDFFRDNYCVVKETQNYIIIKINDCDF